MGEIIPTVWFNGLGAYPYSGNSRNDRKSVYLYFDSNNFRVVDGVFRWAVIRGVPQTYVACDGLVEMGSISVL